MGSFNLAENTEIHKTKFNKQKVQTEGYTACSVPQSCPTLFNLTDCSPSLSSVHGIFQARTLEQVAISFSRGSS